MGKKHIQLLVLLAYPLIVPLFMHSALEVPFDPETVTRFITPFRFQGSGTFGWAVMESTQWDIFRPVYSLSVLMDYTLWGTNATMYHVSDLLISWVCYGLALFLLKRRFGLFVGAAAVLLWALSPVQAMSIHFIYGRNDRLVTLFIVLALFLYDRCQGSSGRRRAVLLVSTAASIVLAVLSKETGIYYSILLPIWSIVVLKRRIPEIFRSDLALWISVAVMGVAFFLLRQLAGFDLSIDGDGLVSPRTYVNGMGILIQMGTPLLARFSPDPLLVCFTAALLVVLTAAIHRVPASSRFGALAFAVVILPMPMFWIVSTFIWGCWLWASLWAAGLISAVKEPLWRRCGKAGRWSLSIIAAAVLLIYGSWSGRVADTVTSQMLQIEAITEHAAASSTGPVFPVGGSESPYSEWWRGFQGMTPEEKGKILFYMTELIRLETGDPEASVEFLGY
jgi:hypothetical protein